MILQLLGAALGGAFLYNAYDTARRKRIAEAAAAQNALNQMAFSLLRGHTYAVQVMVDPNAPAWGGPKAPKDAATASNLIAATFAQLGWRILAPPAIGAPSALPAFLKGTPTLWVFTGVWTRDVTVQPIAPGWATMTLAQEVPTEVVKV